MKEVLMNNFDEILTQIVELKKNEKLKNNIFEILGMSNLEIKHSKFLAYLFDKNINGDIGSVILEKVLKLCQFQLDGRDEYNGISLIESIDSKRDIEISRENLNIDIMIKVKGEYIVLIENKIWASEHGKQLFKYANIVREKLKNNNEGFENYRCLEPICIFLTPDGRRPINAQDNNWISLGYNMIFDILHNYMVKNKKLCDSLEEKQKILIGDYIDLLRERIMNKDQEEIKKLWNIFTIENEKKKAMEQIIDYMPNYKVREKVITKTMEESNLYKFPNSNTAFINFTSVELRNLLKEKGLDESFVYFQLCNNASSNPTVYTYLGASKENNRKNMQKFYSEFNKNKNIKGVEQDRSLGLSFKIYNYKEYEKQEYDKIDDIKMFIKNFENDEKYKRLLEIVNNYKPEA